MNYTKGEWEVKYEYNVMLGNRSIASCGGYSSNQSDADKVEMENRANARLISLSPKLYEYVKDKAEQGDKEAKLLISMLD